MTSTDDRPDEVAGRQVSGHWDGDLVIGKGGKSAMGTLVERVSRFLCLVALPYGHDAESVKAALFDSVKDLPAHLRRSLTWDQAPKWSGMPPLPSKPTFPSISPTPIPRGSAAPTKTTATSRDPTK
jgi:IS30 family transposase